MANPRQNRNLWALGCGTNVKAMKRTALFLSILAGFALLAGCAKEPESTATKPASDAAFVGDSTTKVFYRNIGKQVGEIPDDRKVYFKTMDEASAAGYASEKERGVRTPEDE